ncbi:hypothetical protein EHV15_35630 [Paenibacillus oralis]|uniref:Uncharacterized protein n=1 Tax=Paenibacillus oralis TaxID=2490856 RepID=A0A3P3TA18_9BACL|nr:hypothetical protein [Paenibacillus oralis]RRJ54905.1 hypothetical protein EHV15_35630 [Paenibacillus oralis]
MQLTIDHLNGPGTSILKILQKWAMFEFFDSSFEKTGLMVYEGKGYRFRIPFQIGEMHIDLASKGFGRNQVRLTHWASKHSSVFLKNNLTSLIECEYGYKAVYARETGSGRERALEENLVGKTYFLLRDYPIGVTRFLKIETNWNHSDAFKALHGAHVQLKARVNQDWIQEITSIPFVVEYIGIQGDEITLTGSNDTEIMIKGFKGIRPNPDLGFIIFDVYDQANGYSLSFHLMSQKSR